MELSKLFVTASIPVLEVLLITALGSFLALDSVNILGEDAKNHLNNVVFYVFNPSLVASNLAKTITSESMAKLNIDWSLGLPPLFRRRLTGESQIGFFGTSVTRWFMPINILITFIIGSVLGGVVILITRPPRHLRGLILGCCAAGNMGNILLIIIPSICKEKGGPFGAPDVCQTYGMAYVSLSMAIGAIFLWSYVYNIVRISSTRGSKESEGIDHSMSQPSRESSTSELGSCTEPLLSSSNEFLIHEDNEDQYVLPCTRSVTKSEVAVSDKLKHVAILFRKTMTKLKTIFAPSTIGVVVGFAIGVVPQIRKLMIGEDAPLRVIQDSVSLLGDGAIPAVTLILGGNLLKGLRGRGIPKSLIIGIVVARYICLPLAGIFIVRGAYKIGLVHSDPLYQFILLIQYAVPPAMNIGTITQLFGAGESECSVIMLWTYALASISLTLWSTFFMWLVA